MSISFEVSPEKTIQELMHDSMSVSWDQIDSFFNAIEGSNSASTKAAWGNTWARNKQHIFKAFGNKLKIEKEVELSLNDRDVENEMRSMITSLRSSGKVSEATLAIVSIVLFYLNTNEILENKISRKIRLFAKDFGAGMKVSKMLGRLILDEKERYEVQTAFSVSAQSFKSTGTLVVSIDPMDILAMSLNPNSDWRSCHNIIDGEFRAGAISYLCDSSTFIAYVYRRTGTLSRCPEIEIPNKVWRQIGYFSNDLGHIALSTHYPSVNKNNRKTLVSIILETLGNENSKHGFIESDSLFTNCAMENYGRYHYNDLANGRESRSYFIDLSGKSNDFGDFDRFVCSLPSSTFEVGAESVESFDYQGEIRDSERVDGEGYYDDDDDY